jgi:hypothetical protein
MKLRYVVIAAALFAIIAVVSTRLLIQNDGLWSHFDYKAKADMDSFREGFFSLFKPHQAMQLDKQKRIVFEWIYLFIDERTEQKIHFTALAFMMMFFSYIVFLKLLSSQGHNPDELRTHAIGFVAAFFYFANPIAVSHFVQAYFLHSYALFPMLFYSVYMTVTSEKTRYPLILGLLSSFTFMVMVHNLLYMLLSFAGVFLTVWALERRKGWLEGVLKRMAMASAVFLVLSAFLLLPVAYITLAEELPQPRYVNTEQYVSRLAENAEIFRILLVDSKLHPWGYLSYDYPFPQSYYPLTALVAIFAIALCLLRPSRLSLAALACLISFVFLAKSVNAPFGEIYDQIIFGLPGFGWLFRGGQKFAYIVPFFLALGLAHSLASLKNLKHLAMAALAILIIQSVFAWPVWTGNFAGSVTKMQPANDFIRINSILGDETDYRAKAAWYGDYLESSEVRSMRSPDADTVAMRNLLDNGRSVVALERIDEAVGINYLLIGLTSGPNPYYIDYAYKALKSAKKYFEKPYGGNRFHLFRTGNASEIVYIPDSVLSVYDGFDSLYPLFNERPEWGRTAVIFTDNDPAAAAGPGFSDELVFGPGHLPDLEIDEGRIIPLGKKIDNQDYLAGWVESADSDVEGWQWHRVLEERKIYSGQWLYGRNVIFTASEHGAKIQEAEELGPEAGLSVRNVTINGTFTRNGTLSPISGGWLRFTVNSYSSDAVIRAIVRFYDKDGNAIGSGMLSKNLKKAEWKSWEFETEVPDNAAYLRPVLSAEPRKGRNATIWVDVSEPELRKYDDNSMEDGFSVPETADYEVYVRAFRSVDGGLISVQLDRREAENVSTLSDIRGFGWSKIYDGPLDEGMHVLKVTNIEGFNAVNVAYYKKKGDRTPDVTLPGNKTITYVLEAESDFDISNGNVAGIPGYSREKGVKVGSGTELATVIEVYQPGEYSVTVKGKNVSATMDGAEVEEGQAFLTKGLHEVGLRANGSGGLADHVMISKNASALENGGKAEILSYEREGPTTYRILANSTSPYLFVFTEDYDVLWRAEVDGEEIEPVPVYGLANGFFVNRTGMHEVRVYFGPQPYHEAGIAVSAAGYLAVIAFLAGGYWGRWNI